MTAPRTLAAALAAGALLLSGCSGQQEQALPDIAVNGPEQAQELPAGQSLVGFMHDVTRDTVTLRLPDGTLRAFAVRPEQAERLGLGHLRSHMGLLDVGFEVRYENVDGTDYLLAAFETAPPTVSTG